ncbi:MAG: hypothetical protein MUD12_15230 [Spirochaetes bacterium]|jgi:hypothetical protein|nr:hypothetical protein [Spirochaetota bacterium]
MDFVEEKTPGGLVIKIFLKKWQFLAFDKKGRSIYVDGEGRSMVHDVPLIIFVGVNIAPRLDYNRDYVLLKIRNSSIIIPYYDNRDRRIKYFFIQTDKNMDMIPARIMHVNNVAQMVREIDMNLSPDYVAVDEGVTANDIIIIKSRYKLDYVYNIDIVNNYSLNREYIYPEDDRIININTMSGNPVFLARIHLRNMDLSKINQLLLDFDISALDTEYIMQFIREIIEGENKSTAVEKNMQMLTEISDSFEFYHHLLRKDTEDVKSMIDSRTDARRLEPFRTLVSKVKSMYPGKDDQLLYTEYDNFIMVKREALSVGR